VSFATDLPFASNPAGDGTITIAATSGSTRNVVATLSSIGIPVATALTAAGTAVTAVQAARTAVVDGVSNVTILIPAAPPSDPPTTSIVVTVTDPLGRSTSMEVV